ncbi:9987_t:CDS:1, partial [Paraglomus occultum]
IVLIQVSSKQHDQYKYGYTSPVKLAYTDTEQTPPEGWKQLITFLESTPDQLGWVSSILQVNNKSVYLEHSVGVGRTSVVYFAKLDGESVAVKVAKNSKYAECLVHEQEVLKKLSDLKSAHIPQLCASSSDVLTIYPFCYEISNFRKNDIKAIISTLQK